MRKIRVTAANSAKIVAGLQAEGFQAEYLGDGTANSTLWGGCGDPNCCPQHNSHYFPIFWGSILTDASGNQAHKVIVRVTR